MKLSSICVALGVAAAAVGAAAQPSAYFLWKNVKTGQTMCEPQADQNWTKVSGPYEDVQCKVLAK